MALNFLNNGIGGTLGDSLALAKPLVLSGNVWYVNSTVGSDAASPRGQNREKPLATLQQAVTNAADGDLVVLLSGHAESISTTVTINKKLIVIGEGSAAGLPTVSLTQSADVVMLSCTVSRVELRNILFPEPGLAVTTARVAFSSTDQLGNGCYFRCGSHTGAAPVTMNSSDRLRLENCTFISTATDVSLQPFAAVLGTTALADIVVDGLVLSDGTVGFSNLYSWDTGGFAITRLRATNISLLLGADMKLHASSTGLVNVATATGGGKVVW